MANKLSTIYKKLLALYGLQGWWPVTGTGKQKPTYKKRKTLSRKQRFEVCVGAVLTQNASWKNVEQAIENLHKLGAFSPKKLLALPAPSLKKAIRPAGYFNQKARYLKNMARFLQSTRNRTPTRHELLEVKGIGQETADSILLYAYQQPEFVVDAYTKRILTHLKIIKPSATYTQIKHFFQDNLPHSAPLYNEYHALLVAHAKRFYQKRPYGQGDALLKA